MSAVDVEIAHADGTLRLDAAVIGSVEADIAGLAPRQGATSTISGQPSMTVRIGGVETGLTADECARLLAGRLGSLEVAVLRHAHGECPAWDGSLYDSNGDVVESPDKPGPRYRVGLEVGDEASRRSTHYLNGSRAPQGWDLWTQKPERAATYPTRQAADEALDAIMIASLRAMASVREAIDGT